MGWQIRVTRVQKLARRAAQASSPPVILAQWSAGPQGLDFLVDLCHLGLALRTADSDVDTARYVLSAAVLRSAIQGNAVFADAPDSPESMTGILRSLRALPPPELVFVEVRPRQAEGQ